MTKTNGTGNHGPEHENDPKIARFPTPAERAEIERLKAANDVHNRPKSEPILNIPPVVKGLSMLLIAMQLLSEFLPEDLKEKMFTSLWFIPANYSGDAPLSISTVLGPFTHMLLHGGWMHLCMNLGMLLAFGSGLEREIGGKRVVVLLLATGVFGAFTHWALFPHDTSPLIGASGGISGLFGAVLMMAHARGQMGDGYGKLVPFIVVWIGISLFFGFFGMPGTSNSIAWTTHIGGFIAGIFLYRPVCRLKI
ncbi:MAG: rhomboid family intramembrane serine protease [Micavibrio sp.]|nr:rhomboid family intramembrane serine protease [Micavibrio sp.]